jgi:hypothetical protein
MPENAETSGPPDPATVASTGSQPKAKAGERGNQDSYFSFERFGKMFNEFIHELKRLHNDPEHREEVRKTIWNLGYNSDDPGPILHTRVQSAEQPVPNPQAGSTGFGEGTFSNPNDVAAVSQSASSSYRPESPTMEAQLDSGMYSILGHQGVVPPYLQLAEDQQWSSDGFVHQMPSNLPEQESESFQYAGGWGEYYGTGPGYGPRYN